MSCGLELGVVLFVLTPVQTYQLKRLVGKNRGVWADVYPGMPHLFAIKVSKSP